MEEFIKKNLIKAKSFHPFFEKALNEMLLAGGKRFIPKSVLDSIVDRSSEMYTVQEAFRAYKKYNPNINFRAFIGRIEKGSIPSVKIGSRRYIPKEAMKAAIHIAKNYYTVKEALDELKKHGIHINRNAFERRLDRRTIPHFKIGGRRFIHKSVMNELINQELSLRNRK